MSDIWQALIKDLWSYDYREIMEELLKLQLKNHGMIIAFRSYPSGHTQFAPHKDS
ncbi:MAG: hypothetical protein V7L29_32150 [Nostoc sp.]|uniref:hypothetical protein n=1 Tax=Nostoc sp. TaxID=1180 RepID=UPI002FF0828E